MALSQWGVIETFAADRADDALHIGVLGHSLRDSHDITFNARRAFRLALLWTGTASAQDRFQKEPGKFDFYVLSLSWSPSFCDAGSTHAQEQPECGPRAYSFVVHGLWPQYERGFPKSCLVPPPRLPREIASSMLDLMPAPRLVYHEWDEHGTCSGLSAAAYFKTVRDVRSVVKIPTQYSDLESALTVNPNDVRNEFIKVNPKLASGAISIDCDKQRLREVRICFDKDLGFRDCPGYPADMSP